MNIFRIIILTFFIITITSCTTSYYYDFENAAIRFPISKGHIAYELVSLEQDLLLCQDSNYDKLVLTDPYFKTNKEMLDYLRKLNVEVEYFYYELTLDFDVIKEYGHLNMKKPPNVLIKLDSIYINFTDSSKSYNLSKYFSKNYFLNNRFNPLTKAIKIVPIKVPKENKNDFEVSFILTILNEDGSLLDKRHLNLKVERIKKVNTFLTPWP